MQASHMEQELQCETSVICLVLYLQLITFLTKKSSTWSGDRPMSHLFFFFNKKNSLGRSNKGFVRHAVRIFTFCV